MEAPRVDGWKVRSLVGSGECGQVFLAEDEDGKLLAVKVLDESAINRPLLAKVTLRLEEGGWPDGVMPVLSADFEESPAIRVSDWFGTMEGESLQPWSLHHRLADHPGAQTLPVLRALADALAAMHARGVAHGNLKPGNVFFDESGKLLLTDWALGNMPGIEEPSFTDALLYQSPEQLNHPPGYLEGKGLGWDVFAFGALAYRLLTGTFPRCDDAFKMVAPAPGEPVKEGIYADLPKIARRLEAQPEVAWPEEPADAVELGYRKWIERCLALEPARRPTTMSEVAAGLAAVEKSHSPKDAPAEERPVLLPVTRPPASAPPVSATRASAPPASATPASAPPASATPASATPASATPASATPASATPASAPPVSATPVSATPVSATPVSATPVSATRATAAAAKEGETPTEESRREALLDQRRAAGHRAWRAYLIAALALAAAVALALLWQMARNQVQHEKRERLNEVARLRATDEDSQSALAAAEAEAEEARRALDYERELALSRLGDMQLIGDRLFSWALEKGHRQLPPLDGREQRLEKLERHFEEFLTRTAEIRTLEAERAKVRLQLAEISLSAGDSAAARDRLGEAVSALEDVGMTAELRFRIATDRLLLALLMQVGGEAGTAEAFKEARGALDQLPQTEVDADRLNQLLAILDFHEAKLLAARGDDDAAIKQLMSATQTLNRLADHRPDSVVLRSELAAGYLSSATILEGIGRLGDAREVRALAAAQLAELVKKSPEDTRLRLELAGCYGAMAESAVLAGDAAGADKFALAAIQLLETITREQADNAEAIARMAAQYGVRAGLMRDRGEAEEALKMYDRGIEMLEGVRASHPTNPTVAFRLALLWWQKGRMVGMAGDREEEIGFLAKSRNLLTRLENEPHPGGPPLEQMQRSEAYLMGDLGHAHQLADKPEAARDAFREAVTLWGNLVKLRPENEEYEEGLAWCRQRLNELQ